MNNQRLMLKQLDRQLKEWEEISRKYGDRPRDGWVKTIRMALGMTTEQLAERLGVARRRIVQLENAEKNDAVTLRTLRKAADAMGCELVYVIVPKKSYGNSLQDILEVRANEIAETSVEYVSHSMALENQAVKEKYRREQKEELAKKLLNGSLKKLWRK